MAKLFPPYPMAGRAVAEEPDGFHLLGDLLLLAIVAAALLLLFFVLRVFGV